MMQRSSSMSLFRVLLTSVMLASAPVRALHRASRPDAHHADAAFSAWLPRWFTFGASAWPQTPTALTDVLVAPAFFSKAREDEYAYEEIFHLQAAGVYVELSAVNADFSHSKFFSGSLGWKGVTIEASPVAFRRLVQSRKDTLAVNAAICANHTTVHYVHHADPAYHGRLDGVYEFMPPHFKQHWYNNVAMPEQALPVVCAPLSAIFMKLGLTHIHFLVLDADGGELAMLMTIDFSAVHIDVLCIEQDGTNTEKDGLVRQLLGEQGYRLKVHSGEKYLDDQISANDWYVHPHFQPVSAPTFG